MMSLTKSELENVELLQGAEDAKQSSMD
uniref:Uncharacterized protein n=1 Tax=Arundo donax TaxID=35708 RepID=A0A0A8YLT6_ARUDO